MFAGYLRVKPGFVIDNHGMAEYDEATESFHSIAEFGKKPHLEPLGHPIHLRDGKTEYIHFGTTIPHIRVPARAESLSRLDEYEAYTCLKPGSRLDKPDVDRAPDGKLRWGWKRNTPPIGPQEQKNLVNPGLLVPRRIQPYEGLLQLRDRDSGRPILAHFGSCYWNEFRKRFVLIFVEGGGESSQLGEVWYAEGDSPLGPWAYAVKIITHDRYTFYNPKQHPAFAQRGGRVIYVDGCYSHDFSGNPEQTPRYDYNQIMYRLDLEDGRLALPVAIYRAADGATIPAADPARSPEESAARFDRERIAFFALDHPAERLIAVYRDQRDEGRLSLDSGTGSDKPRVAFYALSADATSPPATTVPLFEHVDDTGRREYSVNPPLDTSRFRRAETPLCRVWKNPFVAK